MKYVSLLIILSLAACSSPNNAETETGIQSASSRRITVRKVQDANAANNPYQVVKVRLDPAQLKLFQFEPQKVSVLLELANGETVELLNQGKVAWKIKDENIAKLSGGMLRGNNLGKTTLVATVSGQSAEVEVQVNARQAESLNKSVIGLLTDRKELVLDVGQSQKLNASARLKDGTLSQNLLFSTDRRDILQIDPITGQIIKLKPGEADLRIISGVDSRLEEVIPVRDSAPVPITKPQPNQGLDPSDLTKFEIKQLQITPGQLSLGLNQELDLAAFTELSNGIRTLATQAVSWKSSDATVATISAQGRVKGLKAGKAVISATSTIDSSKSTVASIDVKSQGNSVKELRIPQPFKILKVGETQTLKAEVVLEDGKVVPSAQWSSSDQNVARVDEIGRVTGVGIGKVTLMAKPFYGGNQQAEMKIEVQQAREIAWVRLEPSGQVRLDPGETQQLSAKVVFTDNSESDAVSWSSSDSSVISVSDKGEIKALKVGRARITVRSQENNKAFNEMIVSSPKLVNGKGSSEGMTLIAGGKFTMGNDQGDADERPAHSAETGSVYLDVYEVTNREFLNFVNQQGYTTETLWNPEGWSWKQSQKISLPQGWSSQQTPLYRNDAVSPLDETPVTGVSWYEADAFCRWKKKRLPTEAEWELAARGNSAALFPWGNSQTPEGQSQPCNCNQNNNGTAPVGQYPVNFSPYGSFDMVGNVWEWVNDWYKENTYSEGNRVNAKGPSQGTHKVARGGSWLTPLRSISVRGFEEPTYRQPGTGFRCALDP